MGLMTLQGFRNLLRQRAMYLWILLAVVPLSVLAQYVSQGAPFFRGQSLAIVVMLSGGLLATLAWVQYRSDNRLPRPAIATLGLIGLAWLLQTLITHWSGFTFNVATFVLPLAVVFLIARSPSQRDVQVGALVFAYAVIGVAVAGLLLDLADIGPSGFETGRAGFNRIPLISGLLGIESRWEGPFGNVNYTSPIAAFLVVLGAGSRGKHRWLILISGLLMLLMSQGRAAIFAMAVGLLVLVLWGSTVSRLRYAVVMRWTALATFVVLSVAYVRLFDPTLALRTPIWNEFVGAWWQHQSTSGWIGVLLPQDVSNSSFQLVKDYHGHNVFLELLVRFGLVLFLVTLVIVLLTLWVASIAARGGESLGLALVSLALANALFETTFSWSYLSLNLLPLVLGLLISATGSRWKEKSSTATRAIV